MLSLVVSFLVPKAKYWVNNIDIKDIKGVSVGHNQQVIGLYRGGLWRGSGHFSGWYSSEYMCGAVLLGYFIIESPLAIKKGEKHIKEVRLERPKRFKKLYINSLYTQYRLSAKNNKEALDLFFEEKWEDESFC